MTRRTDSRQRTRIRGTLRHPFAIVGYIPFLGARGKVGSLLVALADPNGAYHFAGAVRTGFTGAMRVQIGTLLEMNHVHEAPIVQAPPLGNLERWALPKYVAEVEFAEWVSDGTIARPSFQRLCEDLQPRGCVRADLPVERAQPSAPQELVRLDRIGRYVEIESGKSATEPAAE